MIIYESDLFLKVPVVPAKVACRNPGHFEFYLIYQALPTFFTETIQGIFVNVNKILYCK